MRRPRPPKIVSVSILAAAGMIGIPMQQTIAADLRPLNGGQISKLIKGNTCSGESARGTIWTFYNAPDGTLYARFDAGGKIINSKGSWRVKGDDSCVTTKVFDGCSRMLFDGTTYFSQTGSDQPRKVECAPGNPNDLR